jgi:hypothetical protein
LGKSSNAGGAHTPEAHCAAAVQKAPDGARQVPPVHGVLIGQSLAVEQVAQALAMQAWVMQVAGVHASEPDCTQKLDEKQEAPAQSEPVAQGSPPPSAQTPALQCASGQSVSAAHALQTLLAQRPLAHESSSGQGSPTASLQSPAWHTPLKQPAPMVQVYPKCPRLVADPHEPAPSHVA